MTDIRGKLICLPEPRRIDPDSANAPKLVMCRTEKGWIDVFGKPCLTRFDAGLFKLDRVAADPGGSRRPSPQLDLRKIEGLEIFDPAFDGANKFDDEDLEGVADRYRYLDSIRKPITNWLINSGAIRDTTNYGHDSYAAQCILIIFAALDRIDWGDGSRRRLVEEIIGCYDTMPGAGNAAREAVIVSGLSEILRRTAEIAASATPDPVLAARLAAPAVEICHVIATDYDGWPDSKGVFRHARPIADMGKGARVARREELVQKLLALNSPRSDVIEDAIREIRDLEDALVLKSTALAPADGSPRP